MEKCFLITIAALFVTTACSVKDKPGIEPFITGGTLIWSDEFDEDSLDLTKWNYETGTGSQYGLNCWGNNEKQFYSPDNVIVKDGYLYIEARMDPASAAEKYTSGKITTGGNITHDGKIGDLKFAVKPGMRVEARIKSTRGKGFWPGFWLIGATNYEFSAYTALGWPRCGEIDIIEIKGGQENWLRSTIHYGPQWPRNRHTGKSERINFSLADTWNTFGVTWDNDKMYFLFNGDIWYTINLKELNEEDRQNYIEEAFNAESGFFINFNFAIGGDFINGSLPDDSIFSKSAPYEDRCFMVDWVRVYKR